jgi:hypothetical protein
MSYIKVVEFQTRGLVHLHMVIRADGGEGPADPPPLWLDTDLLIGAVQRAVQRTGVAVAMVEGTELRRARWGTQHDVRVLAPRDAADATAIAAYVAKYATKTADGTAWLAHRIRNRAQLERLVARPHIVAMARTAWMLGAHKNCRHLRLRDHAHTLGYPGQFSSKSVRFSTTFAALRQARADFTQGARDDHFDYDGEWRYAGRGYANPEADTLAASLLEAQLQTSVRVPRGSQSTSQQGSQTP